MLLVTQKRTLLVIVAILITPSRNFSENDIQVSRLLERVGETYRNLKSYRFEATLLTEEKTEGKQTTAETLVSLAIVKTTKARVSVKSPKVELLAISNGQTTWLYMDRLKQFVKKDVPPADPGTSRQMGPGLDLNSMVNDFAGDYTHLEDRVESASLLREEPLEVKGKSIECYVLTLKGPEATQVGGRRETERILWVDKVRNVILKEVSHSEMKPQVPGDSNQVTRTAVFNSVEINEPLPDDLFVFLPPEGAQQVEQFDLRAMRVKNEVKPEAPDFTLKDLDGYSFHLKSQRGKAVLIEFWASWCGPCRIEMPFVERLHRRFQHKGLTVVGINDEDPEVAQDFLQDKDFTFPMLVDKDQEVASAYEVEAIPTLVLIDREGKIVHREVGLGNERQLRESLKKIGIDAHGNP